MSEPIYFASGDEFRAWLADHHADETELIVGYYKRGSPRRSLTWSESVDQALCFGWIDGVRRSVDEERTTIRFTPRKPTSHWSAINVANVEALRQQGLMTAAGEAAFARRREDNTARASYERAEPAVLAPDHEARFRRATAAWAYFTEQAPWYQRTAIHWVTSAKRDETRERRLAQLIEDSAAGRRLRQLDRS